MIRSALENVSDQNLHGGSVPTSCWLKKMLVRIHDAIRPLVIIFSDYRVIDTVWMMTNKLSDKKNH